jgi:hypothetical protein
MNPCRLADSKFQKMLPTGNTKQNGGIQSLDAAAANAIADL